MLIALVVLRGGITAAETPPWQRTETRVPCTRFSLLRMPYFGDLHVHTRYSADAYIFGTRVGPRDTYDFARGGTIPLADANEAQTRSARLDRPLDFVAVTDHAEFYGEVELCSTPGSPVYDLGMCQDLRQAEPNPDAQFSTTVEWLFLAGIPNPPPSHAFCSTPGVDCDAAAVSVWQDIQAAAEEAYDRTDACTFTSFVGYEHTPSPLGRHLHRNVIFRNATVPPFAASFLETQAGGTPQGLWSAIETQCLQAGTGCDAVLIPHNPNLSGGQQWLDPADAAEALRRQTLEPLAEIHQQKGNSECRFDRLARLGVGTNDELCSFEQLPHAQEGPGGVPVSIEQYPRRNLIRDTLEDGLTLEEQLGVNPFRLGFVGGTDTHSGTSGNVTEIGWEGGQGANDASPTNQIKEEVRTNPGGLTVTWAEENSRDAIFSALRRRETYATSGTRPVVRFFGGELAHVSCGTTDFVHDGYARGTPMGGELGAVRGTHSPRFAVWAAKDPGTLALPGTDLQRVQIVKGWTDADGIHEQVFDVAGDAHNGATVDAATCDPVGAGFSELCAVWEDPTFKRSQRAFYYVRVLENPTCRWSTRVCKEAGVDPLSADCTTQAAGADPAFANCCLGPSNDAFLEPVIQERAWTSPIWYRPDGIARLRARLRFGTRSGDDALVLRVSLARRPLDLNVAQNALTISVTDDDEVYGVTIPAGSFRRVGRARFQFTVPGPGHQVVSLTAPSRGETVLTLRAGPLDLSHADRAAHLVSVNLAAGSWRATHTRLWTPSPRGLRPEER